MPIRPCAEFNADFPDDMIEEDGEIVQYGGRGVAGAISGMLRAQGYEVSEPEHQGENGWDFEVIVPNRRVWIQISDLGEFILASECLSGAHPADQNAPAYAEVLSRLNEAIQADPRFSDIRWLLSKEVQTGAPGAPTPVA